MPSAPSLLMLLVLLAIGGFTPSTLRAEPVCGDGVLDAGEACDLGSANGAFTSCCTTGCDLREAGEPCRASAAACDPDEVCDGATPECPADVVLPDSDGDGACDDQDVCPATPDPGQEDDDGDGRGNACDPCTNVAATGVSKAIVKISKLLTPQGDDRLKLKAIASGIPASPALDPVAHGLRFVLTDALGAAIVDARLPGGAFSSASKTGWKASATAWSYSNGGQSLPLIQGISKVSLKGRPTLPGVYSITVVGKRGSYAVTPSGLPLVATLVFDPPLATTGQCVDVAFPPGRCVLASSGTLVCK